MEHLVDLLLEAHLQAPSCWHNAVVTIVPVLAFLMRRRRKFTTSTQPAKAYGLIDNGQHKSTNRLLVRVMTSLDPEQRFWSSD